MAVHSDSKLAWAMQEAGFKCSSDEAAYRAILQQVGSPLSEQAVAEVLSMMAQTQHAANIQGADQMGLAGQLANIAKGGAATGADGSSQSGWHWLVVIDALKASAPALNWQRVGELLDHPTFSIPSQHGFTLLLSAYKHATGSQLPVKVVVGRLWNNHAGQLSFLRHAVNAPPELFSFELSERKLPPIEGLQGGKSPTGTPNQAWLSIDLLHILCIMVTDTNNVPVVREMVDHPLKACPEGWLYSMSGRREGCGLRQYSAARASPQPQADHAWYGSQKSKPQHGWQEAVASSCGQRYRAAVHRRSSDYLDKPHLLGHPPTRHAPSPYAPGT
ncbi:uncharacterized protein HaLaN_09728 [Haematococcus lacustris]|uniref:Uncharacterized protein n=1 Tax=Haematococcus lacustris TaxID=44745 RepID=A0A699ZE37_HAELA|nr:uncharacterized protein HaLaN_09728 [Haematococcus lacustris]